MCKPDTNAGGPAGRSRILLFSLNHSEPTLAAQLTAFPDPGRVSVRDLPASGAPLSRGYEGNLAPAGHFIGGKTSSTLLWVRRPECSIQRTLFTRLPVFLRVAHR